MPREPQNIPAAIGTQFDIYVKEYLLQNNMLIHGNAEIIKERMCTQPWPQPQNMVKSLGELFTESLEPQNRTKDIKDVGKRLLDAYVKSELFKDTRYYDVEFLKVFNLKFKMGQTQISIPLYCKVDALVQSGTVIYPMDLKVSGGGSGASPKPGYWCSYDESGTPLGEHSSGGSFSTPMEDIDVDWATQGCVYGWAQETRQIFEPFPMEIHAVYLGKEKQDGTRSVKVCGYMGVISSEFQKTVALRLIKAWDTIQEGSGDWCSEELLRDMQSRQEKWF
jgi:hypothetical protein